jgi:hypothetical protein
MRELDGKADECATALGWDAAAVSGCAAADQGFRLEAAAAKETWALSPKNTFVPWVSRPVFRKPGGRAARAVGLPGRHALATLH